MPGPRDIVDPRQLVVEGRDAEVFFAALLRAIASQVQLQCCGGIDDLPLFVRTLANAPGFDQVTSLGIVRDAESDPRAAFQSACSALRNAGLSVPRRPQGFSTGNPRTAVLILPDASTPGMLESICLRAVAEDPAMDCVDQFIDCVSQRLGTLPSNMPKSRVHAFLASRPKADLLLGEAAHAGYWPWDSPAFDHVKRFLKALCEVSP